MSAALKAALADRAKAEAAIIVALVNDYPPGAPISWIAVHGKRPVRGEVVEKLPGDRLRVLNWDSGRTSEIRAFKIVTVPGVFRRAA